MLRMKRNSYKITCATAKTSQRWTKSAFENVSWLEIENRACTFYKNLRDCNKWIYVFEIDWNKQKHHKLDKYILESKTFILISRIKVRWS